MQLERVDGTRDRAAVIQGLAVVLVDCVEGGASVGFLAPLALEAAADYWRSTLDATGVLTWAARDEDGAYVGCVRLVLAPLPNAQHRGEVSKLLVSRSARGRGVASRLLDAADAEAVALGRTLLLLDTETGSPAEALYRARGWQPYGFVPGHALRPDGTMGDTTFMLLEVSTTPGP